MLSLMVAKTPVDGPDADSAATAYAIDALSIPTQTAPGAAKSTKRIALESIATETPSGGNGLGGVVAAVVAAVGAGAVATGESASGPRTPQATISDSIVTGTPADRRTMATS